MFTKTINGINFQYTNEAEFHKLYEEIFKKHIYYLDLDVTQPYRIIDAGGHIGLATIYFKLQFPFSSIKVFEPHPTAFSLLQQNITANKFKDVETYNYGLWSTDGQMTLHVDSAEKEQWLSTTSVEQGAWNKSQQTIPVTVPTTRLSPFLAEHVDILKMDIEGAETEVIKECSAVISNVDYLFIEFHANRLHRPEELVTLLLNSGFDLTVFDDGGEVPLNQMTRRKPTLYLIEGVNRRLSSSTQK